MLVTLASGEALDVRFVTTVEAVYGYDPDGDFAFIGDTTVGISTTHDDVALVAIDHLTGTTLVINILEINLWARTLRGGRTLIAETFDRDCRLRVDFATAESQENFRSRWLSTAFRWFAENEGEDLEEPLLMDVDTGETFNLGDIIYSLERDCWEDQGSGPQA